MLLYKMSTRKLKLADQPIEKLKKLPDPLNPIGNQTRSKRWAFSNATELATAIKAAELAKKRTLAKNQSQSNQIKLGPLQIETNYKHGTRKKSSEKRKPRSTSNSSSSVTEKPSEEKDYNHGTLEKSSGKRESRSNVVAEESMSNGSSAMIENEFEPPIGEESKNKSFLPSLMKGPSKPGQTLVRMLKPNMMKRAGVPNPTGGRKKTAKRRRAKKSCGWFW